MEAGFGLNTVRTDIFNQSELARYLGISVSTLNELIPRDGEDGDPGRFMVPDMRTTGGTPLFTGCRVRLLIEMYPRVRGWLAEKDARDVVPPE